MYVKPRYVLKNNKMLEERWINLTTQTSVVIRIPHHALKAGQTVCEHWEDSGSQDGLLDSLRGGQAVGLVLILYDAFCCHTREPFLNISMHKKILSPSYKLYIALIVHVQ